MEQLNTQEIENRNVCKQRKQEQIQAIEHYNALRKRMQRMRMRM